MKQEKRRLKPWVRWAAAFLALAFAFTFGAQSWITVKISAEESNAAKTYLAQQTDYVNASQLERLRTKLQTLTQPDGLEDYYLSEGGIITVNTETAEALGIDYPVFADMGEIVEVQTTEE